MDNIEYMTNLVSWLNDRTKEYDEGNPTVSDAEWDNKYFELMQLERKTNLYIYNSPTQNIDYKVVNQLNKVSHNHNMLSLDKTKNWKEFISYFQDEPFVIMPKCDGLTVSIKYENGRLVSAETRGNGLVGEDVTHNILTVVNVPKRIRYSHTLVVDGEIVCKKHVFNDLFADEYANARNFAAGSIRLLDSNECANRYLSFIAWNVVEGLEEYDSFSDRMYALEGKGFEIVRFFDIDDEEEAPSKLIANSVDYDIDGLVGRFDDIEYGKSLGETSHHAKAAYAFKFYDEEYETTLKDIVYEVSRTGEMTPVAVFEDIDTGDSIINRASLHNISVMYDTMNGGAYVGEKITVCKMNEIIPQITKAETGVSHGVTLIPIPEVCPICGKPTVIKQSESGVKTLHCTNEECPCRIINKFEHFCGKNGLDIIGLSKKTLGKLIDWGWLNTYNDIYNLKYHKTEWENKEGFGVKSVDKILSAIENSLNCSLEQYICAIGIPLVGKNVAKKLANTFTTWDDFMNAVDNNYNFYSLENFGSALNYEIKHFDYADMGIKSLGYYINPITVTTENTGNSLQGMVFVVTGKLSSFANRDELKDKIESMGGKVSGSVSAKTNYLINNDINSTTGKNAKAKELNVPIISEQEFIQTFLDL